MQCLGGSTVAVAEDIKMVIMTMASNDNLSESVNHSVWTDIDVRLVNLNKYRGARFLKDYAAAL